MKYFFGPRFETRTSNINAQSYQVIWAECEGHDFSTAFSPGLEFKNAETIVKMFIGQKLLKLQKMATRILT